MKKLTILLLLVALLFTGCGCRPVNLMENVPARVICLAEEPDCDMEAADFALRLFRNSLEEGKNTLVSPLSVLAALGMTANGADGETLEQMEQVFGLSREDVNSYVYSFLDGQQDNLKLVNSIWFTDSEKFKVSQNFLETNANYYQADIFQSALDDTALNAINDWVEDNTNGMIPKILDEIPENALLYLLNALAFEAEWEHKYEEVQDSTFLKEDGTQQAIDMMLSYEDLFLRDENATGFLKPYKGGKYAFAVLLPDESVTVEDYVNSLTGERLAKLLNNPQEAMVRAGLPKFEVDYDTELSDVLNAMGMRDAFDPLSANFANMGTYSGENLFISRVLHKTYLSVAEEGTRAAATTAVEMRAAGAFQMEFVILDRPFVYMIVDMEESLPLFIGTLMDAEG